MKPLNTNFVIIDVERGRAQLAKAIKSGKRFKVRMEVEIDTQHGHDDGTSIEFSGHHVQATIEEIER